MYFSIIIPVYNTKIEYFIRCLKSIRDNYLDVDEFEVIIVNDGMADFSEYQLIINEIINNNRIKTKIINNDINMKQGYARYQGLKESQGQYVHFVDSDDELYHHIYTSLKDYLKDDPNFIFFMEKYSSEEYSQEIIFKNLVGNTNIKELKNKMFYKKDLTKLRGTIPILLHSKVFNRKWLLNNIKLWVPNLYLEDMLLITEILLKTEKFKVAPEKYYKYTYFNDSTINTLNHKLLSDALIAYEKSLDLLYDNNRWELRHIVIGSIIGFFSFNSDNMDNYYPFIVEILGKYDNKINFKFFDETEYGWFKRNKKNFNIFFPLIFNEKELFFQKILNKTDDETILPYYNRKKTKLKKFHESIAKKEFNIEDEYIKSKFSKIIDLNSLFLSSILFNLTKFVFNKKILISVLLKKNTELEKIIFGMDINTNVSIKTFFSNIKKCLGKIIEYQPYFDDFRNLNDLTLPDLQFYYKYKDEEDFKIPESNFTIIFDEEYNKLTVLYNKAKYNEEIIELFIASLLKIFKYFIEDNTTLLKDISLSENHRNKNHLKSPMLLNELFEDIVKKNHDKVALIASDTILTYNELNNTVNRVANALIKNGLNVEDRVIINLKRDNKLVIAILAVLKAGGTFIITNPNDSLERIKIIKKNAEVKYVITNNKSDENLNINTLLNFENETTPQIKLNHNNILSIAYTSGSTDKPKGVIITHLNYFYRILDDPLISQSLKKRANKLLLNANQIFIIFQFNLFLFLFNGLTIVLTNDEELYNSNKIINLYEKTKFDIIITVPSILEEYIENKNMEEILKSIKIVQIAGEKPTIKLIKNFKKITNADLYQDYGSTETGHANIKLLKSDNSTIGKPVPNILEKIVDVDGNPIPNDMVGELWVGGLGITKGYLNNSELTKEKFIKKGDISYFKTGDLARCDKNGEYHLIGRIDNQIKIRGQKIEPNEIENSIPSNLGLKKIVPTIKKMENNQYLCLYFTTHEKLTNKKVIDLKKRLNEHLKDKLPKWMLPQIYIYLPPSKFPLLYSGKINIKGLPEPQFADFIFDDITTPRNELEKKIFDYCAEILKFKDFGVTNSFLSMGFTSLSIIKLISKIFSKYNIEFDIFKLFEKNSNIESTAKKIHELLSKSGNSLSKLEYVKHNSIDHYPLSIQQLNLFFRIQKSPENLNNHLPTCVRFGSDFNNSLKLKKAIIKVIEFNHYIKTYFINNNDKIYQKIAYNLEIDIKIHNKILSDELKKDFVKPFNLFKPPLFRFEIYQYNHGEINLLMDIHHIIVDAYSFDLFFSELLKIYNDEDIHDKELSYLDYILDSLQEKDNKKLLEAKNIFKEELKNFPIQYYIDKEQIKRKYELKIKSISIDANLLLKFSKDKHILLSNLILGAIVLSLTKLLKIDNVLLAVIFNGRDNPRYSNVFGIFFKFVYVFFNLDYNMNIIEYLANIKEVFNRGIEYLPFTDKFEHFFFELNPRISYNYIDASYENYDEKLPPKYGIKANRINKPSTHQRNDLYIVVYYTKNYIDIIIEYEHAYYDDEKIENFINSIQDYLLSMINNPQEEINNIL
ncbi:MAG: AMP-binding protein [Methanobrevibacter sp.]|jgi:acyl-coenzyme A synthetase/AMP-(fatty) acid ligase|nr:AMP-binding protein [Candidatus Methanovirga meridionalis]